MEQTGNNRTFEPQYDHVHPARNLLITGGFVFASVLLLDLINSLGLLGLDSL